MFNGTCLEESFRSLVRSWKGVLDESNEKRSGMEHCTFTLERTSS